MSQVVSLELRDEVYTALRQQAESVGISISELILIALERQSGLLTPHKTEAEKETARARFERHFGTLNLEHPTNLDNESIDADLVREYVNTHEEG